MLLMGRLTLSMAIFHSYVSHYQRVTRKSYISRSKAPKAPKASQRAQRAAHSAESTPNFTVPAASAAKLVDLSGQITIFD